jgi:DnaJ domain
MAFVDDPYRILGLPRGASIDEVKRAYRRLAKQHHPDSGGQRTLARFLEIQAAYEQLVGGGPGGPGGQPGSASPRSPWQADAARADATRRAYGTRGRRTGTARDARDASGPSGSRPPPSGEPRRPDAEKRRGPRKATLGSTSYDEAVDQPFDPDWTGSSWYGTTSGTYWTLNPREYADPRKHGPEYQARARRANAEDPAAPDSDPDPATEPESEREPAPASAGEQAPEADPAPADVTTGAGAGWRPAAETSPGADWSATPGSIDEGMRSHGSAAPPWPGDSRQPPRDEGGFGAPPFAPGSLIPNLARTFDPRTRRRPAARLALALAGGIPIALWLVWLLGELTGCGRFAATCEPRAVGVGWLVGLVLVGALVLLPGIAAVLAAGAAGALAVALPATVILAATGGARVPDQSALVLGVVLMGGWLVGVGVATGRWLRSSGRPGPVS